MWPIFISVPYTSRVREFRADEIPAIGLNKELLCYLHKNGYPSINRARWFKNGVNFEEDEKDQFFKTFKLVILIEVSNYSHLIHTHTF